jgi:hypothetical protein
MLRKRVRIIEQLPINGVSQGGFFALRDHLFHDKSVFSPLEGEKMWHIAVIKI